MPLQPELDAIREKSAGRIPTEKRVIMTRATDDLRQSGIVDTSLKPGDIIPDFTLSNATGKSVKSSDLLSQGHLVMSFYRGAW